MTRDYHCPVCGQHITDGKPCGCGARSLGGARSAAGYRFCFGGSEWFIPGYMLEGLERYTKQHVPVGGFLTAVLENDLRAACERADETNLRQLPAYVYWLYNHAPRGCWGSREAVTKWLEKE